jgi:hypothetical protein
LRDLNQLETLSNKVVDIVTRSIWPLSTSGFL